MQFYRFIRVKSGIEGKKEEKKGKERGRKARAIFGEEKKEKKGEREKDRWSERKTRR